MSINRVQVLWNPTSQVVGGGVTTFYFLSSVGTAAQQVAAVGAFMAATEDRRSSSSSWVTAADVAVLNEQTGALEGITTVTQLNGVGSGAGDVNPVATQGLIRLLTANVVAGRLLRGRIFMPATLEADSTTGAPVAAFRTDYDAAAAALIADANTTWVVWSATHGVQAAITSANTWTRFAVLRSRRD